jgi:5'-nucleotidase
MKPLDLSSKKLFLFDMDGVLFKGKEERVKIGGTRIVSALRLKGRRVFVLTNNSTDTVDTIASRLEKFDIDVSREEILTSGLLTAEYLADKYGSAAYFLVGEEGLDQELRRAGHRRVRGGRADVVVVGLDRGLTYAKLDKAAALVRGGSKIVATHAARLYMYRDGPAVATGPIVKALEYATGARATKVGKPSPLMFRMALKRAGCTPLDAIMVGDQVDTDIMGAAAASIDSVLVSTGVDHSISGTPALALLRNVDELADFI